VGTKLGTTGVVARRVRAWIETMLRNRKRRQRRVARRVRAWIETVNDDQTLGLWVSPAACGRGLKPDCTPGQTRWTWVARRVRAWIETIHGRGIDPRQLVARRVRAWIETGIISDRQAAASSPAACGRGLKLADRGHQPPPAAVARRVRAWIETTNMTRASIGKYVARRVRAWIETPLIGLKPRIAVRRPPRAGVD